MDWATSFLCQYDNGNLIAIKRKKLDRLQFLNHNIVILLDINQ